jgi:hypothetical protein
MTDNVASTRSRAMNEKAPGTEYLRHLSGLEAPDDGHWRVSTAEMPPEPPVTGRRTEAVGSSERSGCLNVLIILLKIVFFSFVGLFLLVITGLFVALLVTGTHLSPLKSLFIDPGYETTLLYVTLGWILMVPLIAVVVWIVRRAMKVRSRPVIGIVAALLWIAGLVLGSVFGVRIADKFSVESSGERIVSVMPVTFSRMYVDMLPYTEDYTKFRAGYGPDAEAIDDLPYLTINEDSLLIDNVNLLIGKSSDSLLHVKVLFATRGKDLRTAKRDLEGFSYEIIQRDSLILIPEFLAVPVEQGFRNQSVTVEISVPAGKSVEVSEALDEYTNNRPPSVVRKRIRKHPRHTTYQPVDLSV